MTALDCNVVKCSFNEERYCCRSEIDVKGTKADNTDDTSCGSYRNGEGEYRNSTNIPNSTLSIGCEALKCVFNDTYKCSAEHIKIAGINADNSDQTICASFTCQ